MGETASQRPGESSEHDAAITALDLKPLADKASAQEYADRVNDAMQNHIPVVQGQHSVAGGAKTKTPGGNTLASSHSIEVACAGASPTPLCPHPSIHIHMNGLSVNVNAVH